MSLRFSQDLEAWKSWKKNPNFINQQELLRRIDPIIQSEVSKITGLTPTKKASLKVKAKVLSLEALKNYDPDKAQLNTFLISQLRKLKRFAYENVGVVRIPENRQTKIRQYKDTLTEFSTNLGREPTDRELSSKLGWPLIEVTRMKKQLTTEIPASRMVFSPATKGQDYRMDRTIELIYDSLDDRDKRIFEHTVGLDNKPLLSNNELARKLFISPGLVSQRKSFIANKLQQAGISRHTSQAAKKLLGDE